VGELRKAYFGFKQEPKILNRNSHGIIKGFGLTCNPADFSLDFMRINKSLCILGIYADTLMLATVTEIHTKEIFQALKSLVDLKFLRKPMYIIDIQVDKKENKKNSVPDTLLHKNVGEGCKMNNRKQEITDAVAGKGKIDGWRKNWV
jgi:hypothetical protein